MPPGGAANNPKDAPDVESTAPAEEPTAVEEPESTAVELTETSEPAAEESEAAPEPSELAAEPIPDDTEIEAETETGADDVLVPAKATRRTDWTRVFAYGVLPAIALILALAAGYLKWQDNSIRDADKARDQALQTAKDSTITMLSYKPETVDKDLNNARDLLTGDFGEQYTSLINDVVIPGAQQKKISAVATVPAAASVSAESNKAVVLLFVNQTVVVGQDPPTDTASSVRVTLEKSGDRWLISQFDPV
jgi:Mce-associated membrane protein